MPSFSSLMFMSHFVFACWTLLCSSLLTLYVILVSCILSISIFSPLQWNESFSFRKKGGKWQLYGELHLKLEHQSNKSHSHMEFFRSNGGLISINNLPLSYWKKSVFETIVQHFGGLVSITSQTLNCLGCSNVVI